MIVHNPYSFQDVYCCRPFSLPLIPEGLSLSDQSHYLLQQLWKLRECGPRFIIVSNCLIKELTPNIRCLSVSALVYNIYDNLRDCSTDPHTYTVFLCVLKILARQSNSFRFDLIKKTEAVFNTAERRGCLDIIILKLALNTFYRLSYFNGVLKIINRGRDLPQEVHELCLFLLRCFPPTALRATVGYPSCSCPVTACHVQEFSDPELPRLLGILHTTPLDPKIPSTVLCILRRLLAQQQNRPHALSLARQLCQYYSEFCHNPSLYHLYLETLAQLPPSPSLITEAQQAFENALLQECLEPKLLSTYLRTLHILSHGRETRCAFAWIQERCAPWITDQVRETFNHLEG